MSVKRYYLINGTLGMKSDEGCFLLKDRRWVPDTDHVIDDYLMGYDPTEPDDSPYKTGCQSIRNEIKEISEEQAVQNINDRSEI